MTKEVINCKHGPLKSSHTQNETLEKHVLWSFLKIPALAGSGGLFCWHQVTQYQQEVITKAGGYLSSCHTAQDVLVMDTPWGSTASSTGCQQHRWVSTLSSHPIPKANRFSVASEAGSSRCSFKFLPKKTLSLKNKSIQIIELNKIDLLNWIYLHPLKGSLLFAMSASNEGRWLDRELWPQLALMACTLGHVP